MHKSSETLSERASGANVCACSRSFFCNRDDNHHFMCLSYWIGHGTLMNHTIAAMTIPLAVNRNRYLSMQELLFSSERFCTIEINAKCLCTFTEPDFSGAILRKKNHNELANFLFCKPRVLVSFQSRRMCPFHAFCFVRFVTTKFVLTRVDCNLFR